MDGQIDIFTLLSLVLAVVIFLKLRSVLGRKTGNERPRYDPDAASGRGKARTAADDNVVNLPRRGMEDQATAGMKQVSMEEKEKRIKSFAKGDKLADGFVAIFRADNSFAPDEFLNGAKAAYEMIVNAFAEGNRKVLKGLLAKDVFEGFSTAIADREGRGDKIEQKFVGINRADILEAEVVDNSAQVTVKFVSELISATLDRAGSVISGDPAVISEVTDIWTFARDVASRDPNWRLIATQAAN